MIADGFKIFQLLDMFYVILDITTTYLAPILIPLLIYVVGFLGIVELYHMIRNRRKRQS